LLDAALCILQNSERVSGLQAGIPPLQRSLLPKIHPKAGTRYVSLFHEAESGRNRRKNMKKYLAELVGTFILVLFGCGTAVVAGDKVGILGIAFAFGFALIGAAYGIGPISGCHINPAVSLGVWTAGRMKTGDMLGYWVGQFAGGILAAWVLSLLVGGVGGGYNIATSGLGQDGWGPGYQGEYSMTSAIVFEFVATLIFVVVILGATQKAAPAGFAGLGIGITLVVIHIFGIHITGVSVNPARSLGPALFVGGKAVSQVWLFLLVPSLAGVVAGLLFRTKALEAEEPMPEIRNRRAVENELAV
jgi:aquaporin Z